MLELSKSLVVALKATSALPVQAALLAIKQWQGKETTHSALQRLGISSESRGDGPLIWFHASTFGECAVALPVLRRCLAEYTEKVAVMLTTASVEAYQMLKASMPPRVIVQMIPLDNAVCVSLFMRRWRPTVGILIESPFTPQLVMLAAAYQVRLALINAHVDPRDLRMWHTNRRLRSTLGNVLDKFTLIIPQSDVDVGRFRIFGATMKQMPGWCNELKYAALISDSVWHLWKPTNSALVQLEEGLAGRTTWLAANTVHGEELMVGKLHQQLAPQLAAAKQHPQQQRLVTVIVPQDSGRCAEVAAQLVSELGLKVAIWSLQNPAAYADMDVLLVDDVKQLPLFYRLCEVTLMGNSLIQGCTGHSLAQAAVAGTAIVLGPHAGSSEAMAEELNNAAIAAAEEAAAAVRSTGQVLDDSAWEEAPPSPARSQGSQGDAESDAPQGQDTRLVERASHTSRTLVPEASTGSRPGTAGLSLAPRSTLASRLSYLNRLAPDSPRTILSETDSMCSEISPAEVLRHNFFGTLSTRITSAGPSQHGSPRHPAGALAAVPSGTVLTGVAMQIASGLWDGMSPRNNAGHVPSPFQRAEAGPGSIPGSPLARAVSEAPTRLSGRASALGDSRRHWDLVFSSEQDAVPWSQDSRSAAAGASRAATPRAGTTPAAARGTTPTHTQPSAAAAAPAPTASVMAPQPADAPRSRPSRTTPTPLPAPSEARTTAGTPRTSDPASQTPAHSLPPLPPKPSAPAAKPTRCQDASTQTDPMVLPVGVLDSGSMASLPLVMMAAMVGAMGGAQLTQQQHQPPQLPNRTPSATFTPHLRGVRGLVAEAGNAREVISLSGAVQEGIAPRPQTAPFVGARVVTQSQQVVGLGSSQLSNDSGRSSSFVDDPELDMRAQKLRLSLPHSTWTATSTPTAQSPQRAHGSAAPHNSPAGAAGPSGPSLLPDVRSEGAASSGRGSWLPSFWDIHNDDLDLSGPQRSMQSAPVLAKGDQFEFDFFGSPRRQDLPAAPAPSPLGGAGRGAPPARRPSRLALTTRAVTAALNNESPDAEDGASKDSGAALPWSGLFVRAPGQASEAGAAQRLPTQSSTPSSRSSGKQHHSDPGSPSDSTPSSTARSDRTLYRSESGSPTYPMRVSMAGWMGDLPSPPRQHRRPSESTVVGASGPELDSLERRGGFGSSSTLAADESLRSVGANASEEAVLDLPLISPTEPSPRLILGAAVAPVIAPRGVVTCSRQGSSASDGGVLSNASSEAVLQDSGRLASRGSATRSVDTLSSLRSVRTPRAVEAEPNRLWSLPTPASPRAPLSTRTSNIPPSSPRAPISPRISNIPPASPRAPSPNQAVDAWQQGATIAELQALAANYNPDAETDLPLPETPTSRMSVLNQAASPFATGEFDRPNPFADGLRMPSRFDSMAASTMQDAFMARLAQERVAWDTASPGESPPQTPTTRLSAMNSISSPFATNTFDRPNPFAMDSGDLRTSANGADGSGSPQQQGGRASNGGGPGRMQVGRSRSMLLQQCIQTSLRKNSVHGPAMMPRPMLEINASPVKTPCPSPTGPERTVEDAAAAGPPAHDAGRASRLASFHQSRSRLARSANEREFGVAAAEAAKLALRTSQSSGGESSTNYAADILSMASGSQADCETPRMRPQLSEGSPFHLESPASSCASHTPATEQQAAAEASQGVLLQSSGSQVASAFWQPSGMSLAAGGSAHTPSQQQQPTSVTTSDAIESLMASVGSSNGSESPVGTDILTCLAPGLEAAQGAWSDPFAAAAGAAAPSSVPAAPAAASGAGQGAAAAENTCAVLLDKTRTLVSALEDTLGGAGSDSGSPSSQPGPTPRALQAALQELLGVLSPEILARATSGSTSISTGTSSVDSLSLDRLLSAEFSPASFASLREYSLRIQSLGGAEAVDAAVAVAGLAGVVGASQADSISFPHWEELLLRVGSATNGIPVGFTRAGILSGDRSPGAETPEREQQGTGPAGAAAAEPPCPLPELRVDGLPAAQLCTQLSGRCELPPETAPLVIPGAEGPVLMAAPIAMVSRLSVGSFTSRPSAAPAASADSMADILATMPSLPQLRLPPGRAEASPSAVPASARPQAPTVAAAAVPALATPNTAPAHTAYSQSSLFGSGVLPAPSGFTASAAGSSQRGSEAHPQGTYEPVIDSAAHTQYAPLSPRASGTPRSQPRRQPPTQQGHAEPASPRLGRSPGTQLSSAQGAANAQAFAADSNANRSHMPGGTDTWPQASPDPLASFYTVNPAADLASKAAAGPSASGSSPAPSSYLDVQTQAQPELSEEPARQVGGNMSPARPSQSSTPQDTDARSTTTQERAQGRAAGGTGFVLPATQLSRNTGPAVWHVTNSSDLAAAVLALLTDPLDRRSRGHAAAQAAAQLTSSLVNTVWHVVTESVITPALREGFAQQGGSPGNINAHRS